MQEIIMILKHLNDVLFQFSLVLVFQYILHYLQDNHKLYCNYFQQNLWDKLPNSLCHRFLRGILCNLNMTGISKIINRVIVQLFWYVIFEKKKPKNYFSVTKLGQFTWWLIQFFGLLCFKSSCSFFKVN